MPSVVIVRERTRLIYAKACRSHSGGYITDWYFEAEYDDGSTSASRYLPDEWKPFLENESVAEIQD